MAFKKYLKQVHYKNDKILFNEAIELAEAGFNRAAYIMTWLSCAESLKWRFKNAGIRDNKAKEIFKAIEEKEAKHDSIDKFLIDQSFEYGTICDAEKTKLYHIFENRCLYAHPYNQMPTKEELHSAIVTILNIVLSKQNQFTKSYLNQLISTLSKDKHYLANNETSVLSITEEWINEIHGSFHKYFIEKYWQDVERKSSSSDFSIFKNRTKWIIKSMLKKNGCGFLSNRKWHDFVSKTPLMSIEILMDVDLWQKIGISAQDYLIGYSISNIDTYPHYLNYLYELSTNDLLLPNQRAEYEKCLKSANFETLSFSHLGLKVLFDKTIEELKSYDWYVQQPAITFIMGRNIQEIMKLTPDEQEILGRNIYQVADGGERKANQFLRQICSEPNKYPDLFISGIVLEVFINECNEIRYKDRNLDIIIEMLANYESNKFKLLLNILKDRLENGTYTCRRSPYPHIIDCEKLQALDWGKEIIEVIKDKQAKDKHDNTNT